MTSGAHSFEHVTLQLKEEMSSNAASCVLTYFQGRGRAELTRLMLEVCGITYQERTITKALLDQLREGGELFFQQLPLLELDGMKLVQSVAMVRYIARTHDMYGSSPVEAYQCDMIADGLADLKEHFIKFADYQQRKEDPQAYDSMLKGKLPRYLSAMEKQLSRNGKSDTALFLVGNKLSHADVALLEVLELVEEQYPGVVREYPLLARFHHRMREMDRVRDYLSSTRRHPPLHDEYIAHVKEILYKN